jgi:hypothetical protein
MDIDYLVVADAATAENGKHYIHGGGWDTLWGVSYPVTHPALALAVRVRVPWHDTNQPHRIEFDVVDADQRSIIPDPPGAGSGTVIAGRPPALPVGDDQVMPLTFTFVNLTFPAPGDYAVVVRIDGTEVSRSPFHLRQVPGAEAVVPGGSA